MTKMFTINQLLDLGRSYTPNFMERLAKYIDSTTPPDAHEAIGTGVNVRPSASGSSLYRWRLNDAPGIFRYESEESVLYLTNANMTEVTDNNTFTLFSRVSNNRIQFQLLEQLMYIADKRAYHLDRSIDEGCRMGSWYGLIINYLIQVSEEENRSINDDLNNLQSIEDDPFPHLQPFNLTAKEGKEKVSRSYAGDTTVRNVMTSHFMVKTVDSLLTAIDNLDRTVIAPWSYINHLDGININQLKQYYDYLTWSTPKLFELDNDFYTAYYDYIQNHFSDYISQYIQDTAVTPAFRRFAQNEFGFEDDQFITKLSLGHDLLSSL